MAYKLLPLKTPPGVFRNGTEYESQGRWWNVQLVRWFNGIMRPIGGWVQALDDETLTGIARGGISWRRNNGGRRLVIGTVSNLYAWDGGALSDITPAAYTSGDDDAAQGFGYGTFTYGSDTYGDQRTVGENLEATVWSMDLWGQDWVGVAAHERVIYDWGGSGVTPAVAVSNAPTASAILVTEERFLVALGAGTDPRLVQWSDQEDHETWTPSATNQAGDFPLQTKGVLMAGARVSGGQCVLLTSADAFVMSYVGPPFVYGFDRVGSDCGAIGRLSHVEFDGKLAWMGRRNFWVYDGTVRPIPCDVADYVFNDINLTQAGKVHTAHLPRWGEIWWFYPTEASDETDAYVVYNYREGHWSIGTLDRTCWVADNNVWDYPHAVSSDGTVYEQENGWSDDGSSRTVYAQSGPVEIAPGNQVLWAIQVIPDEATQGEVAVAFRSRFVPNGDETSHGPYTISGDYVDVRIQGRQLSQRVEQVEDADWRWGTPRLRARVGSGR